MSDPQRSDLRFDAVLAVLVAVAAFAVRFAYIQEARACPMFEGLAVDGLSYWRWSSELVAGDWVGTRTFYQAPLYPYFLGVVRVLFGDGSTGVPDLWSVRIVQIVVGAAACAVLALAARRFLGRGTGIATGVLAALYPPAIFFDGCIQKAGIGFLWLALLLFGLALVVERATIARWIGTGAALAALMLTREESVLLAPTLLAWCALDARGRTGKQRAIHSAAFLLGLVALLGPVTVRNRIVGGEFVLTTSQAGPNFYIGNNPNSDGTYVPLRAGRHNPEYERQDAFELAAAEAGRVLTPSEVSRFWIAKSFGWIRDEPGAWLALMGRKTALLVNAHEMPDTEDIYFYERYVPVLRVPFAILHMGTLVPLATLGFLLTWKKRRDLRPLHLVLGVLAVGVVIFYVFARYRYPVVSSLLVFAGAGIAGTIVRIRAGDWRSLAVPAGAAVLAAIAANAWTPYPRDHSLPASLANAAVVQKQLGNGALSVELGEQVVALRPTSAEYWGNLGLSYMGVERFDDAVRAFRRSLELGYPEPSRAHLRLGTALLKSGDAARGLPQIEASLATRPDDREALGLRARALVELGRSVEAVTVLRELARAPDDRDSKLRLAWTLATAHDPRARNGPEAVTIASALDQEARGRDPRARDVLAAALAESGRTAEAAAIVRAIAEALEARSDAAGARKWRADQARYERGEPTRSP